MTQHTAPRHATPAHARASRQYHAHTHTGSDDCRPARLLAFWRGARDSCPPPRLRPPPPAPSAAPPPPGPPQRPRPTNGSWSLAARSGAADWRGGASVPTLVPSQARMPTRGRQVTATDSRQTTRRQRARRTNSELGRGKGAGAARHGPAGEGGDLRGTPRGRACPSLQLACTPRHATPTLTRPRHPNKMAIPRGSFIYEWRIEEEISRVLLRDQPLTGRDRLPLFYYKLK